MGKGLPPYDSAQAKSGFNMNQGLTDLQMSYFQPDTLIAKYSNVTSEYGQSWLTKAVAGKSANYHHSRGVNNFAEHFLNPDLSQPIALDPPMAEREIDESEDHEHERVDEDDNGNIRVFVNGAEERKD
ncbi:hypothetical protein LTR17_021197 [Elasticomyces elasticus]|nr:hypothetical protein LTR17_021197 [Elasticomyces elasticus]